MSLTTLAEAILAGLANGAFYAFLALPFTIVLGLTRALNLAHGELVILGGYVGYTAGLVLGLPPALLVVPAALALVPLGLLWRALLRRVREPVELNSLVVTFGLSLLLQSVLLAAWSADYRLISVEATGATRLLLPGLSRGRALAAALGITTLLGLDLLLRRTHWGVALRAMSRNPEAAALMGVNTDRASTTSFAVAAALAGAGGVVFGAFHYLHPASGIEVTLLAVTLAILSGSWSGVRGRVGRLPALLSAGLALGLAESLTLAWTGGAWRELVVAAVLLGVLLLRPPGAGTVEALR